MLSKIKVTTVAFHPLADLFPLMEGAEFDALRDDIKKHGLREPIWILDDCILDGRNRQRACDAAGIKIKPDMIHKFDEAEHGDPLAWVISKNLKRRHLNETQRSWVASKLVTLKQGHHGKDANLNVSQEAAAGLLNVSIHSISNATKVREKGTKELQHAVDQGHLAVSLAADAVNLPKEQQREVAKKATEGEIDVVRKVVKKAVRKRKEEELGAKQRALPTKKYGVIVADPAWKFKFWSANMPMSSPDDHYGTTELEKIKQLDVSSIAARECVLFLWTTVPMYQQALEVITAWGFAYVSQFVWVKDKAGTGYWNRNKHEVLLVCTRGAIPAPAPGTQIASVIEAKVGKHSEKPAKAMEMIEKYFPSLPKVELFCRGKPRKGWDGWGSEAETE